MFYLFLIPLLIQADTHGSENSHVNTRSDGDNISLLASDKLGSVEELAIDGSNDVAGLVLDLGARVEEVALHDQLLGLAAGADEGADCL